MRSGFDSPTAQLLPAVASLTTIFCQRRDLHVQLVHAGMHPDLLATQSPLMASPSPFISTTRVGTPRTCRWFRVLVGVCVCVVDCPLRWRVFVGVFESFVFG